MAELADARDLKSRVPLGTYGFESRFGHAAPELTTNQTNQANKHEIIRAIRFYSWLNLPQL